MNGHGREANKRVGEAWLLALLNTYSEEMTKGAAYSKDTFNTEECAPAKHAKRWVKDRRRGFGFLSDTPAFRRAEEYLQRAQARPLTLKCIRLGARLER